MLAKIYTRPSSQMEKLTGSVRNHQYGNFSFLEVDQRTWWARDFKIFKVAILLRKWKN
jgi:hypothetical protein